MPWVRKLDPGRTSGELAAMAARFPERAPRPSAVTLDEVNETAMPAPDRADERVLEREARRLARRANDVVRGAIVAWPDEDAKIFRLHFGSSMSIADISRTLVVPQRALYRRIEALVSRLRTVLVKAGLDAAVLAGVTGEEMDFGLR